MGLPLAESMIYILTTQITHSIRYIVLDFAIKRPQFTVLQGLLEKKEPGNMVKLYPQGGKEITSISLCGVELFIRSQTSTVQQLKFGNR